jgi:hypothetical protein
MHCRAPGSGDRRGRSTAITSTTAIAVSVVSALADQLSSQEVLAVMHRLFALANTLGADGGKAWRVDLEGQDYTLLDEALFRAAARAPLMEAEYMSDMKFDTRELFDITP